MASTSFNMTNFTNMAGGLTFSAMGDITKPCSPSMQQNFNVSKKNKQQQMAHVSSFLASPTSSSSSLVSSSFSIEPASTPSLSSCSSSFLLPLVWREIHGSNNWEGLLEPLHPLLQDEIVRYGKFVTACYEAFDLNPSSRRYLNCKFGKRNMLTEVGLQDSGYEVTKYIYATPDVTIPIGPHGSSSARWIGYVAISTDAESKRLGRRDVVITFRGTVTNPEWVANLMSSLTPARLDPHNPRPEVKVELGFLSLYTADESESRFRIGSCREQLLSELSRLMKKYKGEKLSITLAGHSMGSSLALLLAYDISELGLNWSNNNNNSNSNSNSNCNSNNNDYSVGERVPITVFSFGGPRVGNSAFKERCDELGIKVLRVVNVNDPITKLPGIVFNENFRALGGRYEMPWSCSCYAHVGVELALDFFNVKNPSCVHDLEAYLSLLKCPLQGDDDEGKSTITLDLLQKAIGFLLSVYTLSNMLPWLHATSDIVNLIPIIWT